MCEEVEVKGGMIDFMVLIFDGRTDIALVILQLQMTELDPAKTFLFWKIGPWNLFSYPHPVWIKVPILLAQLCPLIVTFSCKNNIICKVYLYLYLNIFIITSGQALSHGIKPNFVDVD